MFSVGERVRFIVDVDEFGHNIIKAGTEATVERVCLKKDGETLSHYILCKPHYAAFPEEIEAVEPINLENE